MYFNEKGNFVERDYYSDGNLYLIMMYGYIDGKRVGKSKYYDSESDNPPPPPKPAPQPARSDELLKPADTRYEHSLEYKYVNGKLSEKRLFSNRGELGMRYVYNHTPNQVEELVYTKEGNLNQKFLVTFDKDGNAIEKIFFGLTNYDFYGDHKQRYTNEFDNQANWIKQTATAEVTKNGVSKPKPSYEKYRTITYY